MTQLRVLKALIGKRNGKLAEVVAEVQGMNRDVIREHLHQLSDQNLIILLHDPLGGDLKWLWKNERLAQKIVDEAERSERRQAGNADLLPKVGTGQIRNAITDIKRFAEECDEMHGGARPEFGQIATRLADLARLI